MQGDICDSRPFEDDYLPPKIVGRYEQIQKLYNMALNRIKTKTFEPRGIFVTGLSGYGKTAVIRRVIENEIEEMKKSFPKIKYIYCNIKNLQVPSSLAFYKKILEDISSQLCVNYRIYESDMDKTDRHSGQYYLDLLKKVVKNNSLYLILVIDEFNRIIDYENDEGFFRTMIDMYLNFRSSDLNNPSWIDIFPILITNDNKILNKINVDTKSRIMNWIHFTPYDMSEIYQILKLLVSYGCSPEKNYDDIIKKVALEISKTTKSMRDAKKLFLQMINEPNFDKAWHNMEIEYLKEDLNKINFQEKIILYSIIKRQEEIEMLNDRPNANDYKNKIIPTIGSMYGEYNNQCLLLKEPILSYKTFQKIIKNFETMGLIKTNMTNLGRKRGISTLIYIACDILILKNMIKDSLLLIDSKIIDGMI